DCRYLPGIQLVRRADWRRAAGNDRGAMGAGQLSPHHDRHQRGSGGVAADLLDRGHHGSGMSKLVEIAPNRWRFVREQTPVARSALPRPYVISDDRIREW